MSGIFPSMIDQQIRCVGYRAPASSPPIQNIRFEPAALWRPEAEKRVSFLIIYVSLYICPQRQKEALRPRPAGDGTDAAREAAETVPRGIGTRSAARCTGHAQAG